MRRARRNKRGATLAELLVTFALIGVFLAAAAAVITPASRVYLNLKYQSYAQNVSDILLEKVCGEIASASSDTMVIDTSGSLISFSDSKASPLYIALSSSCEPDVGNEENVTRGYLLMHYREIYFADDVASDKILWPAVNWKYDLNAYQGFEITSLTFAPIGENPRAVAVSITLNHKQFNVEHTASRIVECYNLDENIKTDTVYTDDDQFWEKESEKNVDNL